VEKGKSEPDFLYEISGKRMGGEKKLPPNSASMGFFGADFTLPRESRSDCGGRQILEA
jgi:hypothetical protein